MTRTYDVMNSSVLEEARKEANFAFDEHCAQWEQLQKIPRPTALDLEKWLSAKNAANIAQERFEAIIRQIYG